MTSSKIYWQQREAEALKHYLTEEKEYQKRINDIYDRMLDDIQKEIDSFYARYADKEGITLAEAKKRVKTADIKEFERKAKRYVKEKNFSKRANEEMRLYNLIMKVNRLEMLKANIGLKLISNFDELNQFMEEILQDRTEEELERQAGILGNTIQNNAELAHMIVNASFHNATFSDRIWLYQDLMRDELGKLLEKGLIQGKNPRVLARELNKVFNTGKYNCERLMRTELARVQIEAQRQSYIKNGNTMFTFIANSDCCDVCKAINGKHFYVKDMLSGTNAPPMHPNCRCSTAPYSDRKAFDEWLDFVSNGGTSEEWEKLKKGKKAVAKNSKNVRMKSKKFSGALTDENDPYYERREKHANSYYDSIRNSNKDDIVQTISKNTGMAKSDISKVFDHMFINEYELYSGKKHFDASYDMAESVRRLREGKDIQEHDLIMLKHERLEYDLMNNQGMLYDEAHAIAEKKYNYNKALKEFKNRNNL